MQHQAKRLHMHTKIGPFSSVPHYTVGVVVHERYGQLLGTFTNQYLVEWSGGHGHLGGSHSSPSGYFIHTQLCGLPLTQLVVANVAFVAADYHHLICGEVYAQARRKKDAHVSST